MSFVFHLDSKGLEMDDGRFLAMMLIAAPFVYVLAVEYAANRIGYQTVKHLERSETFKKSPPLPKAAAARAMQ